MNQLGNFLNDFEQGHQDAPPVLEKLSSLGYQLEQASKHEDMKEGIDFWIIDSNGIQSSIQLKCCRRIAETGNIYFQTTKVVPTPEKNKTVIANNWLYYDVFGKKIYNFKTRDLVAHWEQIATQGRFHRKKQESGSYTEGYIFPVHMLTTVGINYKVVQL